MIHMGDIFIFWRNGTYHFTNGVFLVRIVLLINRLCSQLQPQKDALCKRVRRQVFVSWWWRRHMPFAYMRRQGVSAMRGHVSFT